MNAMGAMPNMPGNPAMAGAPGMMGGARPSPAQASSPGCELYVGNLAETVYEQGLFNLFNQYGVT